MSGAIAQLNLPILLGVVRQRGATGELRLEHNDGTRTFRFHHGELASLRSDATGEQLGSWLLRQGVLDLPALTALLARDGHRRVGEQLVRDGRLTAAQRNAHLQELQEQVLLHALEQPLLRWTWSDLEASSWQAQDPDFILQDRHLIWRAMQGFGGPEALADLLEGQEPWQWCGQPGLLDRLGDLPLTPGTAYAVTLIGGDPIGFRTFCFLSQLDRLEAARLVATLWAFGALTLAGGPLPSLHAAAPGPDTTRSAAAQPRIAALPEAAFRTGPLPLVLPPRNSPFGPPKTATPRKPVDAPLEVFGVPEFLDLEPEPLELPEPVREGPFPSLLEPSPGDPRSPERSPRSTHPPAQPLPVALPAPSPRATHPPGTPLPVQTGASPLKIDLDTADATGAHGPEPRGTPASRTAEELATQTRAGRLLAQAKRQAQMGRTVEATRTLEEAVDLQPDGEVAYDAWMMLGRLRMNNPSWAARAIHAFQNAALVRPKEVEPLLVMADLLRRTGAEADAEACLKRARELDPAARLPGPARTGRPK